MLISLNRPIISFAGCPQSILIWSSTSSSNCITVSFEELLNSIFFDANLSNEDTRETYYGDIKVRLPLFLTAFSAG